MDNETNTMKIILGGNDFRVPLLVARENRIIDPIILKLLPVFAQWQEDRAGALAKIGAEEYNALHEITFVAIGREHKELKKEQFLDLPITLSELIAAFNVIAQQTGIFQKSTEGGATVPGEGQGLATPL